MKRLSWLTVLAATLTFAFSLALALIIVAARSRESRGESSPLTFQERSMHPYFPESQIVLDMAVLSHAVYKLKNRVTSCHDARARDITLVDNFLRMESRGSNFQTKEPQDLYKLLLPEGTECLYYSHDQSLGTQVLIVRSNLRRYIAVGYAGTDDWRTALMDGNIMMSDFGPANITKDGSTMGSIFDDLPDGIRVHSGFNEAVFYSEYFHEVLDCVESARLGGDCGDDVSVGSGGFGMNSNSSSVAPYPIFTTGHSLGAADSVLLGATLHLIYPNDDLRSVNFGCPKIGNIKWSFWVNSLQPDKKNGDSPGGGTFEVFRFVNKIDLVPRLPELGVSLDPLLTHTGHTLQMSAGGIVRVSRSQTFIFCKGVELSVTTMLIFCSCSFNIL